MSKSVFISYSRQEVPFVGILLNELEGKGIPTWLDYRSLIPGRPWLDQILSGIDASDVVLLVISNASIASKNVELEYKHALEKNKRIILLIFEAATLPTELQACEWVDFRSSFNKGIRMLLLQLDQPVQQEPAPQTGYKTSFAVWISFALSILMILISIPGWWTLFIPALLIPLPIRILKRDYQYYRLRFALLTLPVVLFLSLLFFNSYEFIFYPILYCAFASCITSALMFYLMSFKQMKVWGKPGASIVKPGRLKDPETKHFDPIPFYIEYAPEDIPYANAIIKRLTYFGHPQVPDVSQAKASFSLISRYKNDISMDPQKHIVYPVIIQDTLIEDENLQRIQWIDFRSGLKNLDNLARLLPQPDKLLKALGVVPISQQVIYPRIIQIIDYYLILLGFFTFSIWIPLSLELGKQFLQLSGFISFVIVNIVLTGIILLSVFRARQALITRTGKNASLGRLIGSLLWMGLINLIQTMYIVINVSEATTLTRITLQNDMRGSVTLFLPISFGLGFILIVLLGIFNWRDLTRWFPHHEKK